MYNGKNKTAISSQIQIAKAMSSLLNEMAFSDVSISLLCKEAGISRQTFYSLFSSKENVVIFSIQNFYYDTKQVNKTPDCSIPFEEFCRGFAHFIVNNKDYFKLLLDNDIFHLLYHSIYETFITSCNQSCLYMNNVLAGGLTGITRSFCEEGCTATPEELEAYMSKLLIHYNCNN
ncbi:MAG: TetR/AcrR family transcriptional regulator [Lachnospiraceae bacterium]|nr:TetR/AcrR family transcriptional regulator [Lachnospiraceae bacterium]